MAYERRAFSGDAVAAKLTGDINAGTTSFSIDDATGWPDGTNGKFLVVIERGEAAEEKLLVQSRSGTTLNLASNSDRGRDDTTPQSHGAGANVEHVAGRVDADEANYTVSQTVGKIAAKGDLLVGQAPNALGKLAVGTNGQAVVADSAQTLGVKFALIDAGGLSTAVAGGGLVGGAGTPLAVNVDNSTLGLNGDIVRVNNLGITTAQLLDGSVTNAKVAAAAVTTVKIADANVTAAKLAAGAVPTFDYKSATSTGTYDANTGSYADFGNTDFLINITIPTWATSIRVATSLVGAYFVTNTANIQLRTVCAGVNGGDNQFSLNDTVNLSDRDSRSWSDLFVGFGTGAQTIKLQGRRLSGAGAFRADTSCRVSYDFRFNP